MKEKLAKNEKRGEEYSYLFNRLRLTPELINNRIVADVGSGPDAFLGEGLKKEFPSAQVVSIDIRVNKDKVNVRADAKDFPFRDETFDTIVAHHSVPVMENLSGNPLRSMREMCRILKKGGILKITPFNMEGEYVSSDGKRMLGKEMIEQLQKEFPGLKYTITQLGILDFLDILK